MIPAARAVGIRTWGRHVDFALLLQDQIGDDARAVERQSIEEGLRRALERNEFSLHYQPKVDFQTGAISGAGLSLRA